MRFPRVAFLCSSLIVASCSGAGTEALGELIEAKPVAASEAPLQPTVEVTTGVTAAPPCAEPERDNSLDAVPDGDAATLLRLSGDVFGCADSVVLLEDGAYGAYVEAVGIARTIGAPLLLYGNGVIDEETRAELDRLAPHRLRIYGSLRPGERRELPDNVVIPSPVRELTPQLEDDMFGLLVGRTPERSAAKRTFVVTPAGVAETLPLLPYLRAADARVVVFDPERTDSIDAIRASAAGGSEIIVPPGLDPTDLWRLELAMAGTELPGGGTQIFPDRRIVAFYGSPVTGRLGVLGEQGPDETVERMAPIVDSYRTPAHPDVVPAFEIIATVADGYPGRDGDYSLELAPERIQRWIDVATEHDVFVLIDLQPGREDFLSQAQKYEEFLRLPNVGLALDPEWRLGPNELPLRRVGSVSVDEVNAVVEWLAELVRRHTLPQKLLVVHQFQRRMVPDRELVDTPPELAVVVHVDGQGGLATKYNTYSNMLGQEIHPDQTLWWGWKNFYDEDRPMARPDQVNALDPLPMVVTFQ